MPEWTLYTIYSTKNLVWCFYLFWMRKRWKTLWQSCQISLKRRIYIYFTRRRRRILSLSSSSSSSSLYVYSQNRQENLQCLACIQMLCSTQSSSRLLAYLRNRVKVCVRYIYRVKPAVMMTHLCFFVVVVICSFLFMPNSDWTASAARIVYKCIKTRLRKNCGRWWWDPIGQ